jgi:hypothetical protein
MGHGGYNSQGELNEIMPIKTLIPEMALTKDSVIV